MNLVDFKKVRFETLGCRLNQIESEATAKYFVDKGFSVCVEPLSSITEEDNFTSLCIINTCTVTQKAEQKARRLIRLCARKFPNAVIIVTGCYAQLSPKEICDIDSHVCAVGGQIKSRLVEVPDLLDKALAAAFAKGGDDVNTCNWNPVDFIKIINEKITGAAQDKASFPENSFKLSTSSFISHSRASLKIQDGCNNSCSYCAIHIARGHSVSIDVQTAIDRVKELEESGHDEVVLTTVNIGQYKGLYNGKYLNFAQLLVKLLENTTSINFRISSLYPEIVNDEFCSAIASSRVRPHFHLSVQSGSDRILSSMNRNYVADDVVKACDLIRSVKPDAFIACDIITGFPGEEDSDFEDTMALCKRCDFAWVHAFPYSERPGTAAASMKHKVPQSVSGERCSQLVRWAKDNKINYINKFKGDVRPAILETIRRPAVLAASLGGGRLPNRELVYHAVTDNFLHCELRSDIKMEAGKTILIRITGPLEDRIEKGGEIEAAASIIR